MRREFRNQQGRHNRSSLELKEECLFRLSSFNATTIKWKLSFTGNYWCSHWWTGYEGYCCQVTTPHVFHRCCSPPRLWSAAGLLIFIILSTLVIESVVRQWACSDGGLARADGPLKRPVSLSVSVRTSTLSYFYLYLRTSTFLRLANY